MKYEFEVRNVKAGRDPLGNRIVDVVLRTNDLAALNLATNIEQNTIIVEITPVGSN